MKISLSKIDLPERDLRASVDEDALDELAASLRDHGQLQPIGVRPKADERFEVVFGSRRTRAAVLNAWETIEASIVEEHGNQTTAASKLIENVQRLDMTPIEEAYGLADLIGDGQADIRQLQRQTGKGREWIRTRLELIDLPEDLQGAIQAGMIGIGVARAFGKIQNAEVREMYVKSAIENGCTAEQAVVWAGNAQFAESGIITMDQIERQQSLDTPPPQVVDQQYHCFICAHLQSWRNVNTLVVCGSCQDSIAAARLASDSSPIQHPVDNQIN